MVNYEHTWDKLLNIKTTGRDESGADQYHHPYEPTPYCVLERLAESGLFCKDDVVLDYGCGKGRVGFFFSYRTETIPSYIRPCNVRSYFRSCEYLLNYTPNVNNTLFHLELSFVSTVRDCGTR